MTTQKQQKLIISVSGTRGIVGQNLTPTIAAQYASAFGTFLKNQHTGKRQKLSVCLGRDSRASGQMLNSAVTAGLCAVGINVIDLGIVTTPGTGVMVKHLEADGGVVITASHNPIEYNGIKCLLAGGIAPPPQTANQIKQLFLQKNLTFVSSNDCGEISYNQQTDEIHINKVLNIVDEKAIAKNKFKVVLDSVNGAGGPVTDKILNELGCQISTINQQPTGLFAHSPEPIAENLSELCKQVEQKQAQVGFAQDPDADRLAIVDECGNYIGEEYTLALAAEFIFSKKTGTAVTNLSTSRMIDDIAEKAGGAVIRTPVGEANVVEAMVENNGIIGGEGNGGVIDLRVGQIRDSLVAIALILQIMTETNKTISQLTSEIGGYYMTKQKFPADKAQAQQILDIAKRTFSDAKLNTTDGCRFDFDHSWLHLRTSNTEPVMRLIVEAKDQSTAQKYIEAVADIRRKILG